MLIRSVGKQEQLDRLEAPGEKKENVIIFKANKIVLYFHQKYNQN